MKLMRMHRRRRVVLAAHFLSALASVSGAAAQAPAATRSLVVLATTDVHGRLRGWDYYDGRADSARSLAAAATIVDSIRAAHPGDVLLVDAGDLLQGNPLTTVASRTNTTRTHPVIAAMNAMRYDAAAVGNHEFNYGLPVLRRALAQARFPFLSANARAVDARDAFRAFTLVRRGDVTIGIIGATTPGVMVWDRDNVKGRLTFTDIVPALQKAAAAARRAGADIVIATVHAGLDGPASYDTVSTRLPGENVVSRIPRAVPGLDLVVYGHSHREMIDTVVDGVRLMQPRNYAATVGVATLELRRTKGRWSVTSSRGASVKVAGHRESPEVLAAIEPAHRAALAYVAESLGVSRRLALRIGY
ncbi:MAG TPA: metallophosphoesterase, partial [Gemmatimonadaceae bacterium]|nr:metallophosphoesterase [Gemmatimonadaceae bacterium]